jgi:PPOX class probable F420-dependent enzyme
VTDAARAWERLAGARVARLATFPAGGAGRDRAPALVPITFAVGGGVVFHAVDHKPKATRALARLRNLAADPRASVLADHYEDDWSALWWVRAEGHARVVDATTPEGTHALDLLAEKYPQYSEHRPEGPVIALDVERIRLWEA